VIEVAVTWVDEVLGTPAGPRRIFTICAVTTLTASRVTAAKFAGLDRIGYAAASCVDILGRAP
jgi:hypothetical protein